MTLDLLYDLTYLPLTWQIGAGVIAAIVFIKLGAPMILFSVIALGVMALYMVDPSILLVLGSGLALFQFQLFASKRYRALF